LLHLSYYRYNHTLPSFPTRRSSDLRISPDPSETTRRTPRDEDEDMVHAPRRRGDQREQGSRTGRCGWITSFLGIRDRVLRDLDPIPGRSSDPEKPDVPSFNGSGSMKYAEGPCSHVTRSGDETRPFLPLFIG